MKNAKMRRIMLHSYLMKAAVLFLTMLYGAGGLRSASLRVSPRVAARGRDVTLTCELVAAAQGLYSVTWYKEHQEFYRYSPLEAPATRLRAVPGMQVDTARSNASHVVLSRVTPALSGNYSCEVIQNAPSFPHSIAFARLDVVGAGGLRATELRIRPAAVARGGDATLACLYELTDAPLYSVKWYRGRHEFYRYSPAELPATKIFPFAGINVDLARSNQSQVVLTRVSFGLSGNFSCEVTADAPSFATSIVSSTMEVVVLPPGPPVISTSQAQYAAGDVLHASCSAGPSRPAPDLVFYINDVPVSSAGAEVRAAGDGLAAATLAVRVQLWPAHYERGAPVLRCRARVPPLYREDAAVALAAPNGDPKIERVTSPGAAAPLFSCQTLLVINVMMMVGLVS